MRSIRRYFHAIMVDKEKGFFSFFLKPILLLLSFGYHGMTRIRSFFFRVGVFKRVTVPATVISVGNLTLGGTGKTPFVLLLARFIKERFKKNVAVLIRGYGADEQILLKRQLKDGLVLVGVDRVKNAQAATQKLRDVTILLDDGFQHQRIRRDLDIVLIDARNPFGNHRLTPRGILREPIAGIKRASVVVFTKTDRSRTDLTRMRKIIRSFNRDIVFAETLHKPQYLLDIRGNRTVSLPSIRDKTVVLVSGIGDPGYFEETIETLHPRVARHIMFADHHAYTHNDARTIRHECHKAEAEYVITTEKDIVKLSALSASFGALPVLALHVEIAITEGEERFLDRLHSLYTR